MSLASRLKALETTAARPDVFAFSDQELLEMTAAMIGGVPPPSADSVPDVEATLVMWETELETFGQHLYVTTLGERKRWQGSPF